MNLTQLYDFAWRSLSGNYSDDEAKAIVKRLFTDKYSISSVGLILRAEEQLANEKMFLADLERAKNGEPIQYIIGKGHFLGRDFAVNASVLIPRPETEELVLLIKDIVEDRKAEILDIGTGSGAIAISLALECHNANVSAIDVSVDALGMAKNNATNNSANVTFLHDDILSPDLTYPLYDIVVSNPPYVRNCEKQMMRGNVLDFEPHLALFVEDADPLIFYDKIATFAYQHLNEKGLIFFEINEMFGSQVGELLDANNFNDINIVKDFNDKDRFVWATKKRR